VKHKKQADARDVGKRDQDDHIRRAQVRAFFFFKPL